MGWKLLAGAFAVGALGAGAAVYFAAKRTSDDLSGQGAQMQAAFEAAGRLTQQQLQTQADAWAAQIAAVGQAQITAAAIAAAYGVAVNEYGITNQFVDDATAFAALVARTTTNPLAVLRGMV